MLGIRRANWKKYGKNFQISPGRLKGPFRSSAVKSGAVPSLPSAQKYPAGNIAEQVSPPFSRALCRQPAFQGALKSCAAKEIPNRPRFLDILGELVYNDK